MSKNGKKKWIVLLCGSVGVLVTALLVLAAVVFWHRPSPQVPVPSAFPEAYHPEENVYNFLLLGLDHSEYLADVVMVAQLDVARDTVFVLQLPRDTYLETEGGQKLNASFSRFRRNAEREGTENVRLEAAHRMAGVLSDTLAVSIPYCAVVNLDSFVRIFDYLFPQGLPFTIPCDMDYEDPEQDLFIHFRAGDTVLNGQKALEFVRFRSGYSLADVGRLDAQKIFLSALLPALKERMENLSISQTTALVKEVLRYLETDAPLLDLIYFARKASRVDPSDVVLMTAPGEASRSSDGTWYYQLNREDLRTAVNLYFNLFDIDVSDLMFDPEYALVDESDGVLLPIYLDESGRYLKVYSASGVNDEPIPIKRKK